MAIVELLMPKMGESIMEATILKWNKQPGEFVQQDESLLEIATDKVDSEVPSVAAGILKEVLFPENAVVPVGAVIARIETEVNAPFTPTAQDVPPDTQPSITGDEHADSDPVIGNRSSAFVKAYSNKPVLEESSISVAQTTASSQLPTANGNGNRFYSPLVLNIASNEGISLSELEKIS